MLYLASTAGRALAQDRAATTTKGDEDRPVQVESAMVEGDESEAPIQLVPLPPGTVFERHAVLAEGADVTAGADEQLIFSNMLGKFGAALGAVGIPLLSAGLGSWPLGKRRYNVESIRFSAVAISAASSAARP